MTDGANLAFAREAMKPTVVTRARIACRAPHTYPIGNGLDAVPASEL